jgi:hypothetical protein
MSQAMLPLMMMMMMMSSSSAVSAFLMMGGEEDDGTGGANNQNENEDEDEGGSGSSGGSGGSGGSGSSGGSGGSGGSGSSGGSAAVAAQPTEIAPVWKPWGKHKISGGTFIKSIDEGSLEPCKDECFEDKDCTGFNYKEFGKKCYLYSGDINFIPDLSFSRSSFQIQRQYE